MSGIWNWLVLMDKKIIFSFIWLLRDYALRHVCSLCHHAKNTAIYAITPKNSQIRSQKQDSKFLWNFCDYILVIIKVPITNLAGWDVLPKNIVNIVNNPNDCIYISTPKRADYLTYKIWESIVGLSLPKAHMIPLCCSMSMCCTVPNVIPWEERR